MVINHNDEAVELWERLGRDKGELERRVLNIIQEELLIILKPSDESLIRWKASENGRKEFINHVEGKLGYIPSLEVIEILWRYYLKRTTKQRDKSLILNFLINVEKKCAHCGSTQGPFHMDHIVPLAKGGKDEESNLQCLCNKCNLKKGSRLDIKYNLFFNEGGIDND